MQDKNIESVNLQVSQEARSLLWYLHEISGKQIVSGQHNYPGMISLYSDRVKEMTGKYPALWGQDFGFTAGGQDGINNRPAVIEEAKRQWQEGSIITFTWHAVRPIDDEPSGWKESVQNKLTDEQWNELVTPGSTINQRWCIQVDVIAGFLKQLRDARIPVLWRPYHEMNGGWFWWGMKKGPNGFPVLWKLMFERFTKHHALNNLLWVWSPNAIADPYYEDYFENYFPGLEYVDILAGDIYHKNFKQSNHDDLLKLAHGKPIALGEVGDVPTSEILNAQPRWVWFMTWSGFEQRSPEAIRNLYSDPRTLTRDDVKIQPGK